MNAPLVCQPESAGAVYLIQLYHNWLNCKVFLNVPYLLAISDNWDYNCSNHLGILILRKDDVYVF